MIMCSVSGCQNGTLLVDVSIFGVLNLKYVRLLRKAFCPVLLRTQYVRCMQNLRRNLSLWQTDLREVKACHPKLPFCVPPNHF